MHYFTETQKQMLRDHLIKERPTSITETTLDVIHWRVPEGGSYAKAIQSLWQSMKRSETFSALMDATLEEDSIQVSYKDLE
jgi:hypothetical protein